METNASKHRFWMISKVITGIPMVAVLLFLLGSLLFGQLASHPQPPTQAAWTSNVLLFSLLASLACKGMESRYAKRLAGSR